MNYTKYIGLPYKDNGRDETGLDCWGLVRLFYKNELNIDLPSYDNLYIGGSDPAIANAINTHKDGWDEVDVGSTNDVCLFNIFGEPVHVGIYLGNNKFLHVREGKDSVVESLDNSQWSKRFIGFFKYNSNAISIVGSPHPLKTAVVHEQITIGATLRELNNYLKTKYQISDRLLKKLVILVDGKQIPESEWDDRKLKTGETVTYKTIPEGNGGRMLLMAAVMVVAVWTGQVYGADFAAAIGAPQAVGTALLTTAVSMAGMALANAIAPVRMPKDPGSSLGLNLFSGSSNQINRFGAIPVVLGRMRVTGVHGATPYVDTLTDTTLLNMLIVWGFGPLSVEDMRVGANAITSYYNNEFAQNIPAPVTLEGSELDSQVAIDQFNQLYGGDVEQAAISPVELTNNEQDGAPWRYAVLANQCSELAVAFSFPTGMRQLVVSGDKAGYINPAEASVELQIRRYINSTGPTPTDGEPWEDTVPYSLVNYSSATSAGDIYGYSHTFGSLKINLPSAGITQLYKKYILCLIPGGSIQLLEGCASDTRGDPSTELLNILKKGTYANLIGTDNAKYTYEPTVPAAYKPIYTFEVLNGDLQIINPAADPDNPSVTDYYIPNLLDYAHVGLQIVITRARQEGVTYATTIDIKTGRIYNTLTSAPAIGQAVEIFSTLELRDSNNVGVDNRSWWPLLRNYGIWDINKSLVFTASKDVTFPQSGYYYVVAAADDEGGVYIDNRPAVLVSSPGYSSEVGNLVYIERGTYPVRVTGKNSGGGAAGIACRITYQADGGLNNIVTPSTILVFGSPGFYYKRKDAFNFIYRIKNLPRGKYEIRVRRTNDDSAEPATDLRNYNKVQLFSVTGYDYVDSSTTPPTPIRPITELPGTGANKAYLARTAIRIQSTNKANGNVDGINAIVQTKCKVWDTSSHTWVSAQTTSNPAALFRYVLTHPANAYRVEESEVDSKIDLAAIQAWSEYCDTANLATGRPVLEYNSILSNTQSVLDTLRDICSAGLASPNYVDGKWTVVVDKPRDYVVQYFTPHNSWGFEATKILPRLPHAFRVTFANRDKAYQTDEILIYNYGYTKDTAKIFEELSLPGVTNLAQAKFMARWHLAQLKLRPERYTINADFEYLICNRGDLVRVTHDVPMWGTGSGRISSINGTTLILTEPAYLVAGVSYQIRIRINDGSSLVYNISSISQSGYTDTISIQGSISNLVESDNLFMLGEVNKETQQLIVLSIEPSTNTSARITLMDYSPSIYTADLSDTGALPHFDANISGRSTQVVLQTITKAPTIQGVLSADGISEEISTGTYQNTSIISFANAPDLTNEAKRIQVQVVIGTSEFDISSPSYFVDKDVGSLVISGLQTMTMYKFRARYCNATGSIVGPWSDIFVATVVGKTQNNYTVPSITMDLDTTFIVAKLPATLVKPSDFDSYEYRLYKDTGTEDFWDIVPDTTNNIKVINSSGDARFNLLDVPLPRISTDGITYRVACRAKDRAGNYSADSALGTIVIKTIQ